MANASRDLRFTYDVFGRLTAVRDGQNSNRLVKQFSYDTGAGRGEGKLAQAIRHNWVTPPGEALQNVKVTETYRYQGTAGALSSRLTQVSRDGLEFEEQYGYDAAGQLTSVGYPECQGGLCAFNPPRTVDFSYSLGHLRGVAGFTSGPITYHPDGTWATIPHVNGVTDHRDVKPINPSQTSRLYTSGASLNYNSGAFVYDGAGHIIQAGQQAYVYDDVGRLRGKGKMVGGDWNTGPEIEWQWRYWYDAFGNLKQHRRDFPDGTHQTRTFAIDVDKNRLDSASYDNTGNLLSWGGGTYGYDESGNVQSVGTNTVHVYTPSDERILTMRQPPGAGLKETYTLRSAGGRVLREMEHDCNSSCSSPPKWNRDYIWRGSQLLATVQPDPEGGGRAREWTWHYTLDHLGSPSLLTIEGGDTYSRHYYAPYGEDMSPGWIPDDSDEMPMRFTGHERDFLAEGVLDDLDYMHARHYTPYVGRFLQIDPVLGSPGSPQSWNRYAYVGNDPVNYTDPTGMREEPSYEFFGSICVGSSGSCTDMTIAVTAGGGPSAFAGYGYNSGSGVSWGLASGSGNGASSGASGSYFPSFKFSGLRSRSVETTETETGTETTDPTDDGGCQSDFIGAVCDSPDKTGSNLALNPVFDELVDMNLSSHIGGLMALAAAPFAGIGAFEVGSGGVLLGRSAWALGRVPAANFAGGFPSGFNAGSRLGHLYTRNLWSPAARWGGWAGYSAGVARIYNRAIGFDRTAAWLDSWLGN